MLRKIAPIFFLFLLLFNAFGYYLLFGYQQIQNRRIALKEMPTTSFKVIKMLVSPYANISDRDFEYVEGSFFYEGKAYDFVKKRIKNDSLEFYCLNNARQDQLMSQLNDYLHQNIINGETSSNQPTKLMLKSFLKDYIIESIQPPSFFLNKREVTPSIAVATEGVSSIYLSPPSPPPPDWV